MPALMRSMGFYVTYTRTAYVAPPGNTAGPDEFYASTGYEVPFGGCSI